MATAKRPPRKAAARRTTAARKKKPVVSLEKIQASLEKRMDEVQHQVSDLGKVTQDKAGQFALSLVDFQRTTFNSTTKTVFALQDQTEKVLRDAMKNSKMVPKEGEKVVNEWIKMIHRTRSDFHRTMELSFDLIADLIKRIQKAEKEAEAAAKKAAAKKKPAAKKPVAKKTAVAKKKPAARKKAPAKKKAAATS